MKFYTLVENGSKSQSGCIAEHGFSLYFEHNGKRILFDTGASDAFIYNASLLHIDLAKVDICVISHAHYDHTGGLIALLKLNSHVQVYMKREAMDKYYIKQISRFSYAGIDPKLFESYLNRIEYIDSDIEIADGVFAANIDKYGRYPSFTSLMYKKQGKKFIHDDLLHELFLNIKTPYGAIVLTGCAHHGILNILKTAENKFGHVCGVVGGFHLNGTKICGIRFKKEPNYELRAIVKYLESKDIKKVYTGHCTGEKPFEKLALMSININRIRSGDIFEI